MRAVALFISLAVWLVALPAHTKDRDDLSNWSLEKLCEKKDKSRHEEAVFAEIERRAIFTSLDIYRIRSGKTEVGMEEAALHCSLGAPDSVSHTDGAASQRYYRSIDDHPSVIEVLVVAGQVTNVRTSYASHIDPWRTFSGREIDEGLRNTCTRTVC